MKKYNILIVGNGVLALSAATSLARKDSSLRIGIVGKSRQNSGTLSAGAMLGCFSEVTKYTFRHAYSQKKFEMCLKAKQMWREWSEQVSVNIDNGTHIILNAIGGNLDEENFAAITQALQLHHEPFEQVLPAHIPGLEPNQLSRPLSALYLPHEGRVCARELMQSLDEIIINHPKIDYIEGVVTQVLSDDQAATGVMLANQVTVEADHVLIAGGHESSHLANSALPANQQVQPSFPGVGVSFLVKVPKHFNSIQTVIRTPNRGFACGLHVLPTSQSDIFYIGATNFICKETEYYPRAGLVNLLLHYAADQIANYFGQAHIIETRVGSRPVALDTYPLVGKTAWDNLTILSGTYRDGIHLSPFLAQAMADLILDNTVDPLIEPFNPNRHVISTYTLGEAKEVATENYLASYYEQSASAPKFFWENSVDTMIKHKVDQLYGHLDTPFVLHPDFLLMLEENPSFNFAETFKTEA